MSGIKTGNKGFVNPTDGKVYTIDPNGVANEVSKTYDPGDMKVDQTVKDINKKTKITLGTYLSQATKSNAYPIDPPKHSSQESSLLTKTGYPSPLTPASSGNLQKFAAVLPSSISDNYAKGTVKAGGVTTLLSKGKSEESATKKLLDGNELLSAVKRVGSVLVIPPPLQEYQNVVIDINTFKSTSTSTTKFVDLSSVSTSFIPVINDVGVYGKYYGTAGEAITKTPLTLLTMIKKPSTESSKNFFPITVPVDDKITVTDYTFVSLRNGDNTPPLITSPSMNGGKVFASSHDYDISGTSKNFAAWLKDKPKILFKKGKSAGTSDSLTGNDLLPGVKTTNGVTLLSQALANYADLAITPNYRYHLRPFFNGNILSPSSNDESFKNPKITLLSNTSLNKISKPSDYVLTSNNISYTLYDRAKKVEISTPGNRYPTVIAEGAESFRTRSITYVSANGVYPTPLSTPGTAAQNAHTFIKASTEADLIKSVSTAYASTTINNKDVTALISKGKTGVNVKPNNEGKLEGWDGNTLLKTAVEAITPLPDSITFSNLEKGHPVGVYTSNVIDPNRFSPGGLGKSSLQFFDFAAGTSISRYEPNIAISTVLGNYSGTESNDTLWMLKNFREKVAADTKVNVYSVDPPIGGALEIPGLISNPVNSLPMPLYQNNKDSYVKREDIHPQTRDASINNFAKGKESPDDNVVTGHTLLKDTVPGNYDVRTGLSKSGHGIIENSPLYDYEGDRGSEGVLGIGANRFLQPARLTVAGRPVRGFSTELSLPDGRKFDQLQMAKVGVGLLQRAAGEIPSITADKFDPTGGIAAGASLLPGLSQSGIGKINNLFLEANDVLNSIEGESLSVESLTSTTGLFDGQDAGQSWGTLTTPDEPFDDPSSIGLSILMALLLLSILVLFGLFGTLTPEKDKYASRISPSRDSSGRLALGKYQFLDLDEKSPLGNVFTVENTLGIRNTKNPFNVALGVGARAFFVGASNMDLSSGQIAAAISGIGLDSIFGEGSAVGANLVVARTIVRSGIVMAQFIDKVIKAGSQNPVSGVKAGLGILKAFRSSKLVSAMNVFSQLGDALLDRQSTTVPGPGGIPQEGSGMDAQPKGVFHSTVRKSRLTDPTGYDSELAWASKRAPSLYLVPKNVLAWQQYGNSTDEGKKLGAFSGVMGLKGINGGSSMTYNKVTERNKPRIDNDLRKEMEERLDAEYVPFYFHDVRTNEIISFHAFLTALTDDYSSSYDSVEGFGRVEPIKIYKGTQRKISFSFIIAATSEDDFHEMWFKINKLTTLAYPQYTPGRSLIGKQGGADYEFKAPFSQMIGASPLVRIRLGDLFRSNYSKFALARLFGAVDTEAKFPDSTDAAKTENLESVKTSDLNVFNRQEDDVKKEFVSADEEAAKKFIGVKAYPIAGAWPNLFTKHKITSPDKLSHYEIVGFKSGKYKVKLTPAASAGIPASDAAPADEYPIDPKQLVVAPGEFLRLLTAKQNDKDFKFFKAVETFLDPKNNVIIKSFESASGKGLAGVIESMNFDWYNQTTWEIAPGYTAPKMCKVSISFSPIHDITPGIDHMGYNRAPIYPVGNALNTAPPKTSE